MTSAEVSAQGVGVRRPAGIAIALAVALVFCCVRLASADALFTFGLDPKSQAAGNASVASAPDLGAPYVNPATMSLLRRPLAGFGYFYSGDRLTTTNAPDAALDDTRGLALGALIPIPFRHALADRVAFGVSFFFPNGAVLNLKVPYPDQPQYLLFQNAGRSLAVVAGLSIRPLDGVAIGGGAQYYDNTNGRIDATVDPNGQVDAVVGEELTTTFSPIGGLLLSPAEWFDGAPDLRLALVFRDEFSTTYEIPVSSYIGDIPLNVSIKATSLYTPRHWTGGLSYHRPRWHAEVDALYLEWSEYPDPNLQLHADFTIPVLPVTFQDSRTYDPDFHDTISLRAGGEWIATGDDRWDLRVRGGYGFEPSPIPAQTGATNYLDSDRHVGALGGGIGWRDTDGRASSLDLAFQYHHVVPRTFHKGTNVDAANPGYPEIGVKGGIWASGVAYSTSFDFEGLGR
ncbi:MAG: outer membrane protein transport protein [Deltaproteobacteria bacterium]|nr:outer membrane protein transport protein [Deltaproteobacteria bacterium]